MEGASSGMDVDGATMGARLGWNRETEQERMAWAELGKTATREKCLWWVPLNFKPSFWFVLMGPKQGVPPCQERSSH